MTMTKDSTIHLRKAWCKRPDGTVDEKLQYRNVVVTKFTPGSMSTSGIEERIHLGEWRDVQSEMLSCEEYDNGVKELTA